MGLGAQANFCQRKELWFFGAATDVTFDSRSGESSFSAAIFGSVASLGGKPSRRATPKLHEALPRKAQSALGSSHLEVFVIARLRPLRHAEDKKAFRLLHRDFPAALGS